jgi:phage tail-like protein
MITDSGSDPLRAYNFELEIGGERAGGFTEIGGLTADGDPVDYREGRGRQQSVDRVVGLRKRQQLTLKRGVATRKLWDWYTGISKGREDAREISITMLDESRKPVRRWRIVNASITKIASPTLNASGNEIAIESIEIVHEGLTLEDIG